MGKAGFYTVGSLAFAEFFGDSLIVLIVMWQELMAVLPDRGTSPMTHLKLCLCVPRGASIGAARQVSGGLFGTHRVFWRLLHHAGGDMARVPGPCASPW